MAITQFKHFQWLVWLILSILLATGLYASIDNRVDQSILMPGLLSDGHHQLEGNCQACHTSAFGGDEVLQEACVECHGNERVKPMDSHPAAKFKDPRNADLIETIDALSCVTCHSEHRLEITAKDGVTQPLDFCVHCHSEIGVERESHAELEFDSCKNSGCHNYHNNRAIYTDYLTKHLDEPSMLERARVKSREFADILYELADYPHDRYPVEALNKSQADVPEDQKIDEKILQEWATTAHAASGVNCTACHTTSAEGEWSDQSDEKACSLCHSLEVERFTKGKHGMRLASGLESMRVEEARLPMHESAAHEALDCNSCHTGHRFDSQSAAVEACLNCHNDEHSNAYQDSPHAMSWKNEMNGETSENTGVSCATCHMPRINYDVNEWVTRTMVDHNQSANLSPNSKMVRQVCMNCHGLDFSLKAVADQDQIQSNFAHTPATEEHPSMVLARRDQERYLREIEGRNK